MDSRLPAYLLDAADQAVLAFTPDGALLHANAAAARLFHAPVASFVGRNVDEPGIAGRACIREFRLLIRIGGRQVWQGEMRLHRWDEVSFPALVKASPAHDPDGSPIVIITIVDISVVRGVQNQLERTIKRLENLRAIDRMLLEGHGPDDIAAAILNTICQMLPCSAGSIRLVDGTLHEPRVLASAAPGGVAPSLLCDPRVHIRARSVPLLQACRFGWKARRAAPKRRRLTFRLMAAGDTVGELWLVASWGGFSAEHGDIAQEIAAQLALALHEALLVQRIKRHSAELEQRVATRTAELQAANQRLQREIQVRARAEAMEREQRRLAEAFRGTAAALSSTLDVQTVLDHILAHVGRVIPHDIAHVVVVESGLARVVRCVGYIDPAITAAIQARPLPLAEADPLKRMAMTRQPFVLQETAGVLGWSSLILADIYPPRSYAGAPLCVGGAVIGFIELYSRLPAYFTVEDAQRLKTFADHAAVALNHAQLYSRSQEMAAIEERQRLSHELHDAVSQTLWSACIIADVLPDLWGQSPAEGEKALTRIRQLTRGALAEMRTLLVELRPGALIEVGLDTLVNRLAEVTASRTGVPIAPEITLDGPLSLRDDVQIGLYRIAQEAMTNIVRHAGASRITVRLRGGPHRISLVIEDDGCGFAFQDIPGDHLGLRIMRERAEAIGARLAIDSIIGQGTRVAVGWPASLTKE